MFLKKTLKNILKFYALILDTLLIDWLKKKSLLMKSLLQKTPETIISSDIYLEY